jgi:drug/metabolite transporter (DMT)-like permease
MYAVPFAFAYRGLSAGTGALILFGCVQVTMLTVAFRTGERPGLRHSIGVVFATAGFVILVWPGLTAPPAVSAMLMAAAGMCWGVYSVRGRTSSAPLADTAANFVRAVPLIAVVNLMMLQQVHADVRGIALSVASGVLASGLGYVAWYAALRGLTRLRAAVVQLLVPVLTAAAGLVFLAEAPSARLVLAAILVLGGIGLTIGDRRP